MTAKPVSPDLTVSNPSNVVYWGDPSAIGTVRFIIVGDEVEIQKHIGDDIWVPGGLRLSSSSVFFANDVFLSGVGSHLQVNSAESGEKSLLLEVGFDDAGTELPHSHVLGPRQNRVVFVSNTVGEIVTSLFELEVTSFLTAFRYKYYFKTGSVAATQDVTMTLSKGFAPGGTVVFEKPMLASDWPANTEVVIELDGAVSLSVGAPLLLTISSAANFSLIGDLANGGNFFAMDFQPFSLEDVVAIPTGTDRFTFSNAGEITIGNDGNPTMAGTQGSLSTTTPAPLFPPLSDPPPPGV